MRLLFLLLLAVPLLAENPIFEGKQKINRWIPKKNHVKIKIKAEEFALGCFFRVRKHGYAGGRQPLEFIKTDKQGRRVYKSEWPCDKYHKAVIECEEWNQLVTFKKRNYKNVCNRRKNDK